MLGKRIILVGKAASGKDNLRKRFEDQGFKYGVTYTTVQTIMHDDPAPLHVNSETMKEWMEDELTWEDVYSQKPVEYLEAISRGEVPKWDTETGKYLYGDSTIMTMGGSPSTSQSPFQDPQVNSQPDEDLPF
jgi:hypothetical protein